MPSRLLREGILESDAVNTLSWPAEVFYRRLMSVVDDYGRFDARPAVLRGRLYTLKLSIVSEADVSSWLAECQRAGLVSRYSVEAKPYLQFHKLGAQQRSRSKFPEPEGGLCTDANDCLQPFTDANSRSQLLTCSGSGSGSGTGSGAGSGEEPAAEPPPKRVRKTAEGPHPEAVRAWTDRWQAKYEVDYPFDGGKDGAAVKWMLGQTGDDVAKLAGVFDRYLADADPFYAMDRHTLGMLRAKFARWLPDKPVENTRDARQRATADERTQHRFVEGRDG